MATTPEAKVKQAVAKALKARGIWYYMPVQNGMGQTGIPDFICCWGGGFLAIETKAPGKRGNLSTNQRRVLNDIGNNLGLTAVVDDVGQLKEYFDEWNKASG